MHAQDRPEIVSLYFPLPWGYSVDMLHHHLLVDLALKLLVGLLAPVVLHLFSFFKNPIF